MAARARDAHRYSSRDRGARVPSKIVDKNTGKAYRTGKMLGKVRLRSLPIALRSARAPAAGRARSSSSSHRSRLAAAELLRVPRAGRLRHRLPVHLRLERQREGGQGGVASEHP